MFDDLLEAWETLVENRGGDPTGSQRFTHRLGVGITKRDKDAANPSKPPPTPGTPAARRRGLIKGLGMRMGGKRPPMPIPKGTKALGIDPKRPEAQKAGFMKRKVVDLSGSKEESIFGEARVIWKRLTNYDQNRE